MARADIPSSDDGGWNARFDLGIDITDAGHTAKDVRSYMSTLAPETQRAIVSGCDHYMLTPNAVRSIDTLPFCKLVVATDPSGAATSGNTILFGFSTNPAKPLRGFQSDPGAVNPDAYPWESGTRYRVFPGDENVRPED